MKRVVFSLLLAGLMLFTSACGGAPSKPSTSKSSQLSSQYAFYETSANSISSSMKITPEQADDVFLILVKCGLDNNITSVIDGTSSLYHVWSGAKSFDVQMKDGIVSTVEKEGSVVYPAVDNSSSTAPKSETKLSLEEAVNKAIESAHADKDKVNIVENFGTESADDRNIEIYLKGKDNLTKNMIREGMLIQANDIMKELQPRPEIAQMCLFWSFPLTDSYGNTKEETVMKILIKKETLDKINFDNFDWNKIPEIADDYNEHSALTAK